jgi:hypothetical protein
MAMHDHPASAHRTPVSAGVRSIAGKEELDPAEAWRALMRGGRTIADHVFAPSSGTIVARFIPPQRSVETLGTEEIAPAPAGLSATRVRYGGDDYLVLTFPAPLGSRNNTAPASISATTLGTNGSPRSAMATPESTCHRT